MLLLHPGRELLDPRLAVLRAQLPGGPQHGAGLVVEFLGQMAGHVAHLVVPAALHEARASEDLADRLVQRLGPVEDEQPRPPGVQAALDEALEQPQRDEPGSPPGGATSRPSISFFREEREEIRRSSHSPWWFRRNRAGKTLRPPRARQPHAPQAVRPSSRSSSRSSRPRAR